MKKRLYCKMKKSNLFTILTYCFLVIPLLSKHFIHAPVICFVFNLICVSLAIAFFVLSIIYSKKE